MYADRMLGKHHLIAEIARGGMGIVYLALVSGPGGFSKLVVIKELKTELAEDPGFLTMFLDEARLAARLSHPNIVQTNEVGSEGNRHYMSMDYLDGRTYDRLRRRAKNARESSLTLPMQLRMFADVLSGLDHAHRLADFDGTPLAVVHRDVSPNNVFVTFDGHVKLLDFGIAKAADHEHETQAGVLKGKVAYMAPEQARGQQVDPRADVFSVGVMMWEAIAGHRMRKGTPEEIVRTIAGDEAPRLATVVPDVPPELDAIVARALASEPERRYSSAASFQTAIEAYLTKIGVNPTARELAGVMTELFHEERAKTNAMIETHVSRARAGTTTVAELPVIEISSPGASLATPVPGRAETTQSSPGSSLGFGTASLVRSEGAINVDGALGSLSAVPAARSTRGRAAAIGGAVVAVAAIAAFVLGRAGSTPASPAAPTTAAPALPAASAPVMASTPPPAAPPAQARVNVEIAATPASATITIDGAMVTGNPFRGAYLEDGVMHRIRIAAPGFEPVTRDVAFDANVTLALQLQRVEPVAARAPRTTRPAAAARPAGTTTTTTTTTTVVAPPPVKPPPPTDATQISPTGGQKPRRTIDASNPYGTP